MFLVTVHISALVTFEVYMCIVLNDSGIVQLPVTHEVTLC